MDSRSKDTYFRECIRGLRITASPDALAVEVKIFVNSREEVSEIVSHLIAGVRTGSIQLEVDLPEDIAVPARGVPVQ